MFFFFRYLSPDMRIVQFSKLAKIFEALAGLQCYTQCPQHIYVEMLLKRHFALIIDKKQLVNTCPQFKMFSLKSAVGILHVPLLSKYDRLSELVNILFQNHKITIKYQVFIFLLAIFVLF